jgi:hypothetical protein
MARIIAPNKSYDGVSASVKFSNGVGETNDPHLIDWFKEHGYTVKDEAKQSGNPTAAVKANGKKRA